MGSIAGAAGTFVIDKGLRVLAGLGISWATKKVILRAEEKEIKKFTPQEGTLGPQPTPAERQEMGEQLAQAHVTRGHRGWGGWIAGVAVGIGVGLLLPATVPFAAAAVITGLAGTATEGVIGVVTGGTPVENSQPKTDEGAEVTGMVPGDGGSTTQGQNSDPSEGQPSAPNTGPLVGGTTTGTTPHEGTSTTTTTTTTTEESTTTHEEPHEPPPAGHEDPHEDFDD